MYTPDKWTDKELAELEKRIAEVFKQAEKDLDKEVKAYFAKFALRDKEMQKLVQTGDMTQEKYQQWRMTQIGRGQRFEALRDKVAERFTQANEVANAYVNDVTPSIYSLNRNYEAYTIEKAVGSCDFTMWDESTVRRLLVSQPDVMPYYPPSRALRRGIDLKYGKEQITKHVTSGILRGLAPSKIASELMTNISTMNRESAVRAARTGVTAAQNAGRMDSYVAAEKMGIKIRRRWVCTKDARTRLAHGMADGQIVEGTEKPFKVGGELMMFPGDQSMGAHGWNIYNCRCTTRTVEKDGIEAEPREMRVRNPEWENAKAEEDKLTAKVDRLKEREQAATDPEKKKQLRKERIAAQHELSTATKKRQGIDKNVVVNEMSYSDWKKWKETGVKFELPKKKIAVADENTAGAKILAEAYERHRIKNGLSSVAYDDLGESAGNVVYANYGKMSAESAAVFNDTISALVKEYDTPLQRIRTMTKNEFIGNSSSFAFVSHDYTVDSAELVINPTKCKEIGELADRIKELSKRGYCVKIPNEVAEKYVAVHEFAHTLINLEQPLKNSTNWLNADYGKIRKARQEVDSAYKKYMSEVEVLTKKHKETELAALINPTEETWKAAQETSKALNAVKLSNYSWESADEFMAEAFAAEKLGVSSNPHSKAVLDILDKYFKE